MTVDDGDLIAKTEVYVNILNSTLSTLPLYNGNKLRPPSFLSAFNPRPPPSIGNNPSPPIPPPGGGHHQQQQPYFQQKTYFELTTKNSILNLSNQKLNTTHLLPIINNSTDGNRSSTSTTVTSQISNVTTTKTIVNDEDNIIGGQKDIFPIDRPVKSVPDLAVTLIPIISVCVIFLIVGGVALIFRKKICIGRAKSTKDDMVSVNFEKIIQVVSIIQNVQRLTNLRILYFPCQRLSLFLNYSIAKKLNRYELFRYLVWYSLYMYIYTQYTSVDLYDIFP